MSKYIHRAKTLPVIPMDYALRWDASRLDECPVTYNTDAATNDVDSWREEGGAKTLVDIGTPTVFPEAVNDADGFPAIHCQADGGLRTADSTYAAANQTVFFVARSTIAAGTLYGFNSASNMYFSTSQATDSDSYNLRAGNVNHYVTSASDNVRGVFGYTLTHNGVNDNDYALYYGATNVANETTVTDALCSGSGWCIGALYSGGSEMDVYIYEIIAYDRVLTGAELTKVSDYLSNKWSAQNSDTGSADIETASTAATWTNNSIDKQGEGTANHPGSQPGEYSIVRVGDREAIYLDENYPMATWGSLVKFWYDASVTSGMTFATGDARSGGTVSSWTDITGATTMNTTKSGDAAVDYLPSFKGKPAIQGGTSGTPKSLESVSDPLFSTTTGHQRLFWCVVDWDDVTVSAAPCGPAGVNLWASTTTGHTGDLPYGFLPACTYNAISSFRPVTVKDPRVGKHVFVWRQTKNAAANGDLESWYAGMRLPDDAAVTWAGFTGCAVGALASSTYDAGGGRTWEMGAVDGAGTAISDAEVDGLIRYLCEKYDVDYMPDTTPMDIGLHARSTGTVAQTDCALWYRSDKNLKETVWGLHPKCAALHTTPGNFVLESYADPGEITTANSRKAYRASDTSPVTSLVQANNYSAAETVDFPADTNGCSSFGVKFHNSSTTTSSGSQCGHYTGYTRFNGVSATIIQHYESNAAKNWTAADAWFLFGGSYHYNSDGSGGIGEAGTPDADPYVWYIANDLTPQEQNAPAATSFNTKMTVGSSIGGALPGDLDCHELFLWKHPLTAREISNLKRYVNWRYGLGLTP